jgi:ABC-type Na+ transport system ATPase subunit NatA
VPRTFTVVTGYAGQGKTSFLMWIISLLIRRGVHVTVASFETDIKPIFLRKLAGSDPPVQRSTPRTIPRSAHGRIR